MYCPEGRVQALLLLNESITSEPVLSFLRFNLLPIEAHFLSKEGKGKGQPSSPNGVPAPEILVFPGNTAPDFVFLLANEATDGRLLDAWQCIHFAS